MVKQEAGPRSSIHDGCGVPGMWSCCTRGDVFTESTWANGLAFVGLLVGWAGNNKVRQLGSFVSVQGPHGGAAG
jgi:hypothetical protein